MLFCIKAITLLTSLFQSTYQQTATAYQQHEFFYQVPPIISERVTNKREAQVIRVFKDGSSFKYKEPEDEAGREQTPRGLRS